MHRPSFKFTLRRLMALVCFLALGLAILRYASRSWGASGVEALAVMALVAMNVLAWFQRARWQVFWIGFGLGGWAYLAVSLEHPTALYLPTTALLDGLHDQFYSTLAAPTLGDDFAGGVSMRAHGYQFRRAGQSVISLLLALLCGVAATILFPTRSEDEEGRQPPDGSLLRPGWRDAMGRRP